MKKTETTATTTTAATATQAPSQVLTREYLHRRCTHLDNIETVKSNIETALDVLYTHFFLQFSEETQAVNDIAGIPNLCGHLETFANMIQIIADRILEENNHLNEIFETMWAEYQEERERVEAASSAAKEREPLENA